MNKDKLSKDANVLDCVCKDRVFPSQFISHAKQCLHFKAAFGTISEAMDGSLKKATTVPAARALLNLCNEARDSCLMKLKALEGGMPMPVLPPVMPPFIEPNQRMEDVPIVVKKPMPIPVPIAHEEEKKMVKPVDDCSAMIDQNSIYCKMCSTYFLNFDEVLYLQTCLHAFCKKDLKQLAFK